ncbi:MAG: carbohydrate-binding domain-containing protein [Prevotellaceae bacterium]|jgi:hypothetical protein|nr:carbohydrate-binding domain-containing protein [Prevotellaceae bacterium]
MEKQKSFLDITVGKLRTNLFRLSVVSVVLVMSACSKHESGQPEDEIIPNLPEIPKLPDDTDDEPLVPNPQVVNFENAVSILFTDETVVVDNPFDGNGVTVSASGQHVTVRSTRTDLELNYILSGIAASGSVKIYGDYPFGLALNGTGITNPHGAALNIQCGKKITVTVVNNTHNRLIDGVEYVYTDGEDMKAAFFSEGKLNMYGTGILEVRGKNKHAICSDDYFSMYEGDIRIKEAASDGIHANDNVLIDGGSLTVRSAGDGIESEDAVAITGGDLSVITTGEKAHAVKSMGSTSVNTVGSINLTVYGNASKGFSTSSDLTITSGNITINTAGNAFYDAGDADITSAAGVKCDGNLLVEGGDIAIISTGTGGKGISVDGDIVISGGVITVTTSGAQYVYSKNNDTAAKAIKSDGNIDITGGTIIIRTSGKEAEGLESKKTLTISDGDIDIVAYDDGINAANHIQINGGRIYSSSTANDGIDSNGTLAIADGLTVSVGTSGAEEGFDCDNHRFTITGGTFVGTGGATSSPTASVCTQHSVIFGSSASNVSIIRIETTSGEKEALTFKMPRTYGQRMTLLFSSPTFEPNTGYTIYTGGSIADGSDFHGFFTDATYTKGTSAGTFTTSSMVSTVGNSSGGGGGGGPGGRP